MGISTKMTEGDSFVDKVYLQERAFRTDRLVEKWSKVPEIGVGLKGLNEATARNMAVGLENQTRYLSTMSEAQTSNNFQGLKVRPLYK